MFKKDFILEIIEIIWVSRKLQKGFDPIVLRLKYRHWRMAALIGTSELMGQGLIDAKGIDGAQPIWW